MNRVEIAAQQLALEPLQTQRAASPVACTPTLGIFFASAAFAYRYFSNGVSTLPDSELADSGRPLELLSGDELVSVRRDLASR